VLSSPFRPPSNIQQNKKLDNFYILLMGFRLVYNNCDKVSVLVCFNVFKSKISSV